MIAGSTLCSWDQTTGCSITPPPKSMTFVLMISFIIAIFVIFLDFFVGYAQTEYAANRPNLEKWGLNTDSWLGSLHHVRNRDQSLVADAISHNSSKLVETSAPLADVPPIKCKTAKLELGDDERDFISTEIFNNFLSPKEECIRLVTRVQEFLVRYGSRSDVDVTDRSKDASAAGMKAISSQLMVNYDGTMKPITYREQLFYKDRQDLIEKKLASARIKALEICESVKEMDVQDDNLKDIALMRKFILEQVSFFYRFSLSKNFEDIDGVPPQIVHPGLWVGSWIFITFVILFFLYWVFAWGVKNGGATLFLWGTNYGVTIAQDCLVCEVCKVCIMYVFAMMSVRPQLQVIKRIINDRALKLVQDSTKPKDVVSVVQHFSPACRAARLSGLSKLPASAILRSITDDDVEKCREHKNFTLGSFIFYTIMFAAIIAAISELFLDQFLSFILASALLGFLLMHAKLIAISPLLVFGVYVILAAITLYHIYIFVPSVKRARQSRVKTAQSAREFAQGRHNIKSSKTNKSLPRDIQIRCGRLAAHFLDFTSIWHAIISNEGEELRKEKDRHESIIWCGMNRSSSYQGSIPLSLKAVREIISSKVSNVGSVTDEHSTDCMIPSMILYMRPTGSAFQNYYTGEDLSFRQFNFTVSSEMAKASVRLPAVLKQSTIGKQARMYMANVDVTTDPNVALRRMLERHLLGAESYKNGEECHIYDFEDAADDFLFMSEFAEMLSWTWGTFYPGGKKLTSDLKLEVEGLFQKWRKSRTSLVSCPNDYPEGCTGILGANFSEFSTWFIIVCEAVEFHTQSSRQADTYDLQQSGLSLE